MADINVSLGLDDSKYKQGLTNAQQSASRLGNQLNSTFSGGLGSLSKFGQGIDALNVKFANLGRVVVGIGLATFVSQALRSADALSDLSAALGVSTARLMEMEVAAGTAGGNLESLSGMLGRMEDNMASAVEGNQKMRDSLAAVGIGFDEIKQLTPEQQFNRIAKSLAGLTDQNKRAALATEIFGKAGRAFDFGGYNTEIQKLTGSMEDEAKAVEAAGKMMDEFGKTMRLVGAEFLKITGPIVQLITPLSETSTAMERAAFGAKVLAGALAVFAAGSIITAIKTIGGAVLSLAGAFGLSAGAAGLETKSLIANTASIGANAGLRAASLRAKIASMEVTLAEAAAVAAGTKATMTQAAAQNILTTTTWRLAAAKAALAGEEATVAAAMTASTVATNANTAANVRNAASGAGILAWLGKYKVALAAVAALVWSSDLNKGEDEELERMKERTKQADLLAGAIGRMTIAQRENYSKLSGKQKQDFEETLKQEEATRRLADIRNKIYGETQATGSGYAPTEEAKKQAQALTDAFNKQKLAIDSLNASIHEKNQAQLDELAQARENLTLTERERAVKRAGLEFEGRYRNDINNLRERERELISQSTTGDSESRKQALAQLPLVQEQLAKLTETRAKDREEIERSAAATYDALNAEKSRLQIAQFSSEQRLESEAKVRALQDEMAKMGMSELEQKYHDIGAAAREAGLAKIEAINAENAANNRALLTEEQKLEIMNASWQASLKLRDATKASYDQSRSFSTGWKKAMNDYISNATNAAKRAENIFRTATQGMEEALVNFAKTGKFEWKNFVAMMLEELLRAQIQQVFAQLMGTMTGTMRSGMGGMSGGSGSGLMGGGSSGGGLLSGITGTIGRLLGGGGSGSGSSGTFGNNNSGMGSMGGGGLLSGLGNIVTSLGGGISSAVGGITKTIGSVVGSIGSGIGSVVSGISDFFGGFFATGGQLGAGKWGIAGEAGPELISGPANITPLGMGGSTNVVYNINAVDARSFQSLVAQDPSFIYSVTEAGRRGLSKGGR